mmetsp:Transcript_11218/g.23250  ORF Transcript_11218/g.23250 Transcript_11218/m.23250 type:complete len:200 (-) Transcript_11218:158-757(-)
MAPQPKKFIKKNGVNMLNPEYLAWKKTGGKKTAPPRWEDPIDFVLVQYEVIEAKDLVAMDRSLFGKKKSSDPFVKISLLCTPTTLVAGKKKAAEKIRLGRTEVIKKNLNPTWNFKSGSKIPYSRANETLQLVFEVFDEDKLSSDDPMGTLKLSPLKWKDSNESAKWYEIPKGSAKKVSGDIKIKVTTQLHRVQGLRPYI